MDAKSQLRQRQRRCRGMLLFDPDWHSGVSHHRSYWSDLFLKNHVFLQFGLTLSKAEQLALFGLEFLF